MSPETHKNICMTRLTSWCISSVWRKYVDLTDDAGPSSSRYWMTLIDKWRCSAGVQKMPGLRENVEKPQQCGRREYIRGPRVENKRKTEEKRHHNYIGGKFCGKLMRKCGKSAGGRVKLWKLRRFCTPAVKISVNRSRSFQDDFKIDP